MVKSKYELAIHKEKIHNISFRHISQKKLRDLTINMNSVLKYIETNDAIETNDLINAVAVYVTQRLGLRQRQSIEPREPFWKRRIQKDINELRKTVSTLDRYDKGQVKKCKESITVF